MKFISLGRDMSGILTYVYPRRIIGKCSKSAEAMKVELFVKISPYHSVPKQPKSEKDKIIVIWFSEDLKDLLTFITMLISH